MVRASPLRCVSLARLFGSMGSAPEGGSAAMRDFVDAVKLQPRVCDRAKRYGLGVAAGPTDTGVR